jgi:hypothetical protein
VLAFPARHAGSPHVADRAAQALHDHEMNCETAAHPETSWFVNAGTHSYGNAVTSSYPVVKDPRERQKFGSGGRPLYAVRRNPMQSACDMPRHKSSMPRHKC